MANCPIATPKVLSQLPLPLPPSPSRSPLCLTCLSASITAAPRRAAASCSCLQQTSRRRTTVKNRERKGERERGCLTRALFLTSSSIPTHSPSLARPCPGRSSAGCRTFRGFRRSPPPLWRCHRPAAAQWREITTNRRFALFRSAFTRHHFMGEEGKETNSRSIGNGRTIRNAIGKSSARSAICSEGVMTISFRPCAMSSASSPSECGETTETSGRLKASRAPAVSRSGVEDPTEMRPGKTE